MMQRHNCCAASSACRRCAAAWGGLQACDVLSAAIALLLCGAPAGRPPHLHGWLRPASQTLHAPLAATPAVQPRHTSLSPPS